MLIYLLIGQCDLLAGVGSCLRLRASSPNGGHSRFTVHVTIKLQHRAVSYFPAYPPASLVLKCLLFIHRPPRGISCTCTRTQRWSQTITTTSHDGPCPQNGHRCDHWMSVAYSPTRVLQRPDHRWPTVSLARLVLLPVSTLLVRPAAPASKVMAGHCQWPLSTAVPHLDDQTASPCSFLSSLRPESSPLIDRLLRPPKTPHTHSPTRPTDHPIPIS
jgi:hypothetical protein